MFALLPDLAPRDSHSLWYTSSRNPLQSSSGSGGISSAHDAAAHLANPHHHHEHSHNHLHPHGGANSSERRRGAAQQLLERSPLARLRADEQNLERRRQNVTNFGSAWLKPPGLPKTLHQLREEQREAEEHQEALRREQLAQELAEAEAEAAGAAAAVAAAGGDGDVVGGGADAMLDAPAGGGDDGMDDVQLDGARDLDDDIPEADAADFGFSGNEDEDDDDDDEEDDEEEEEDDENAEHAAQAQQQHLMAQRMRQGNDAFREDMARGRDSAAFYGGDEEIDDEDQSQMIEEDDFAGGHGGMDDMGMDADLDDEIPEAESMGGYEHTDSEAELSSIIDEGNNSRMSFAASQQLNHFRHSLARSDATRNSIAVSDILSRDGSSVLGSSPAVSRRRSGVSRRGRG